MDLCPRVPLGKLRPAVAHLVVCTEVLVLLHHHQLFASPHQNCPHPTARQVGVQLGRKYIDSSWRQSLERQMGRQTEEIDFKIKLRPKIFVLLRPKLEARQAEIFTQQHLNYK